MSQVIAANEEMVAAGVCAVRATPAVVACAVSKTYPDGTIALRDVTFTVPRNVVCGFLGPNGAGKSTLISIIAGLTPPSAGSVQVAGLDVMRENRLLRHHLGAQLQQPAMPARLRVHELLRLFNSFYRKPTDINQLLDLTGLFRERNRFCSELSGGQKQRLAIARALIGGAELLILDEPSTGLDPEMRHGLLELIEELRRKGHTILLTTHYIEEAERVCDLVACLDRGRLIELDTTSRLIKKYGRGDRVEIKLTGRWPSSLLAADNLTVEQSPGGDPWAYSLTGDTAEKMRFACRFCRVSFVES